MVNFNNYSETSYPDFLAEAAKGNLVLMSKHPSHFYFSTLYHLGEQARKEQAKHRQGDPRKKSLSEMCQYWYNDGSIVLKKMPVMRISLEMFSDDRARAIRMADKAFELADIEDVGMLVARSFISPFPQMPTFYRASNVGKSVNMFSTLLH